MVQHSGSLTDLCSEDGVHYNKADTVLWLKRKENKNTVLSKRVTSQFLLFSFQTYTFL